MKRYLLALMSSLFLMLSVTMTTAQEESTPTYPLDTITVIGTGSASGAPDIAKINIGVETISQDITEAFSQTNNRLDDVISAMAEAGVATNDIRTSGLNLYSQQPSVDSDEPVEYRVTNQVHVTVRDLTTVEEVISAAVDAGANNIFGFNLSIADPITLESEARTEAYDNARQRAEETAGLLGVELGEVLIVNEGNGDMLIPFGVPSEGLGLGGAGGAVIEAGQLTVDVHVQLTYQILR